MRDGYGEGSSICRQGGGDVSSAGYSRTLFVMQINLRDMMDCNDGVMGEATGSKLGRTAGARSARGVQSTRSPMIGPLHTGMSECKYIE